jgi:hypothetical protein
MIESPLEIVRYFRNSPTKKKSETAVEAEIRFIRSMYWPGVTEILMSMAFGKIRVRFAPERMAYVGSGD